MRRSLKKFTNYAAASICLASLPVSLNATTINSFSELDGLTPTASNIVGTNLGAGQAGFGNGFEDYTVELTFTTPNTFTDGNFVLFEAGSFKGISLIMEVSGGSAKLGFRASGGAASPALHVTSFALNASTQYYTVGSWFNDADIGDDFIRLYLNQADAVDAGAASHNPSANLGDALKSSDTGKYGDLIGDVQTGSTVSGVSAGPDVAAFAASGGTLDSNMDVFQGTYLDVIPEPSSSGLLAGMFGLMWVMVRRRR